VLDRLGTGAPAADDGGPAEPGGPAVPSGEDLLPPSSEDAPALPPRAE
jgi:preprotein translocase subunit SecG